MRVSVSPSSAPPWPWPGSSPTGRQSRSGSGFPQCFGTPEDVKLAAFGVSEPDAGSDVSSLKSRAVYDEAKDEWVLNGTKTWITNGGIANTHVLVLSVDPSLGSRGQASFVVPEGTPGISQGQKFKKMGIRASHTAEVVLDDCRVPGRCLLGGKEKLDERLARGQGGQEDVLPGRHGHVRGLPTDRRAPRPSVSPGPPTSTRSSTPRSASSSAGPSSRTRPSPSNWPT